MLPKIGHVEWRDVKKAQGEAQREKSDRVHDRKDVNIKGSPDRLRDRQNVCEGDERGRHD